MKLRRIVLSSALVLGMSLAIVAANRANDLKNSEPLPPPSTVVPTAATGALPVASEPAPGAPAQLSPSPTAPSPPMGPYCCPPYIEYRHHGRPICCCDCNAPPEIKTVLQVKNPATCCVVAIPVCLPGCCTGDPCVSSRCGVLGRGIVHYDYCCGVRITVTFRACGDIVVSYLHA